MPPDDMIELDLISKIVETSDLRTVLSSGVGHNVLRNPVAKDMFQDIHQYYHHREHYGRVPSARWMAARFPGFVLNKVQETIQELCVQVRRAALRQALFDSIDEALDLNDADEPEKALDTLRSATIQLQKMTPNSSDKILAEDAEDIIERARMRRDKEHILGIPYPWEELNDVTQGIQTEDFIIIFGRPKCVVEGQEVLADTGILCPIETPPDRLAYLKGGQRLDWGGCSGSYAGTKEAVRITTRSGHVVEVGEDHPMMISNLSYMPAAKLQVGNHVAVARKLPEPSEPKDIPEEHARLLGLLVGDGNYTRNEVQFTKGDQDVIESLRHCAATMGAQVRANRPMHYRIVGNGRSNPVLDWLRRIGCHGQKSTAKRVPDIIFSSSNRIVAEFLSGYTDTDGCVARNKIYWSTASYSLATDIKHLLLRFGVTGVLQRVRTNLGTRAWYVNVYSQEQHRILNTALHLACQHKSLQLQRLAGSRVTQKRQDDGIPYSDELMNAILTAKGSRPWKRLWSGFSVGKLFRRTGKISRHLLRLLAGHLDAPQLLEWADSDIRWEPITSIESLGPKRCWDITMDDDRHPMFVVSNFIVKNSMKSWVAAKIAAHAYMHANRRVLVYSCEMSTALFEDRVACALLNLSYTELKEGNLSELDWKYYKAALRRLGKDEEMDATAGRRRAIKFCSAYDDPNGGGVAHLMAKMDEFSADFVIVDAFYKMKDDRTGKRSVRWEPQYNIVQDLSGVSSSLHVPVIGVTQRSRPGKKEDEDKAEDEQVADIAYADAVGQEADVVYRVKKAGKGEDGISTRLKINMAASRETQVGGFILEVTLSTKWRVRAWLDEEGKIVKGDIADPAAPGPPRTRRSSLNPIRQERSVRPDDRQLPAKRAAKVQTEEISAPERIK